MERPDGISNGRHIWEKMWRGWKLVGDRFRYEAEWFVKADLDTFVAVENMRAFLSHLNPDDPVRYEHASHPKHQAHEKQFCVLKCKCIRSTTSAILYSTTGCATTWCLIAVLATSFHVKVSEGSLSASTGSKGGKLS